MFFKNTLFITEDSRHTKNNLKSNAIFRNSYIFRQNVCLSPKLCKIVKTVLKIFSAVQNF